MTTTDAVTMTLLDCYRQMRLIRRTEERMLELHGNAIVGSFHPALGQEAIAVGTLSALGADDPVVATYRGHHWALACGIPPADLIAEVAGRATGPNGGRGGSAYLSSPRHRFYGENSIVGAGIPIADGLALASQVRGDSRVVVVAFGDGATNQGSAFEGMVFAIARQLPVVFICENNGWSEMTAIEAMVPVELAARAGALGMPAQVVDGYDPAAVAKAVSAACDRARSGGGPTFLECRTSRLRGHYQADVEHYRTAEERERALAADVLEQARQALLGSAAATEHELDEIDGDVEAVVDAAIREALAAPQPDPESARDHVYIGQPRHAAPPLPESGTQMTYAKAVNAALQRELVERPEMLLFGEDVALPGGVFGVTRNLADEFGNQRVFDTPISEAAILGSAVGAAIAGMRPVVEIMFGDFLLVALDQLINQAANVAYLHRGQLKCPMVVRTQHGTTPGACAQHAQQLEALLAHIPGLRIGLPSTAADAYAMTRAAISCDDPVVLYESRALYNDEHLVDLEAPLESVGGARLHGDPADVAIISWGRAAALARDAQANLQASGIGVGMLDLRWLNPLDEEAIFGAVRHASRVLIVHEANVTGGFGAEIAARISEHCFHDLDAPPARLGLPDVRVPAAPALQGPLVVTAEKIVTRVQALIDE